MCQIENKVSDMRKEASVEGETDERLQEGFEKSCGPGMS